MLHAGFVDSLYLNRQKPAKDVSIATKEPAIEVPRKGGVWEAPATLRSQDGQSPTVPSDRKLMIVRVGIHKSASDAGKFTLSQWRLVCGPRGAANPLAVKGQTVYPIGYIGSGQSLVRKPLDEVITIQLNTVRGNTKDYDFAFAVPSDLIPILIAFKRNNLEQLSAPVSGDEAAAAPSEEGQAVAPGPPQTPPQQAPGMAPDPSRGRRGGRGNQSSGSGTGLSPAGQAVVGGALDPDINPP